MSLAPRVLSSLEHIWRLFYCKLRQTSRLDFIWMVCVFVFCFSNGQTYLEELFPFSFKPSCRTGPWTCSNQKRGLVGGSFTIQSQLCIRTPYSQNFNNACDLVQDVPTLVDSLWIWYHNGTIYSMLQYVIMQRHCILLSSFILRYFVLLFQAQYKSFSSHCRVNCFVQSLWSRCQE